MTAGIATFVKRLKAELAADKKRATVLGVLLLVFCGALGRLVLGGTAPTPAPAHATAVASVATGESAASSEPSPGAVVPSMRPTVEVAPTAPPVAGNPATVPPASPNAAAPDIKQVTPVEIEPGPRDVTRDLFASPAWSSFPTARKSSTSQPSEDEGESGFWGRFAAGLAERGIEHRGEIERVEKLAQDLRVQATMSGPNPTAYISGRVVHVGDTIKSFSVVAIDERSVTVALDGFHVELRIP